MKIRTVSAFGGVLLVLLLLAAPAIPQKVSEDYLSWDSRKVEQVGRAMYGKGRVGTWSQLCFHCRLLKTDQATGYKLRATLFTPEVIRATARLEQLKRRLPDDDVRQIVKEAEMAGDVVIMVEIDPDEGSGVIPREWEAFLGPRRKEKGELEMSQFVRGVNTRSLRKQKGLQGVLRRNYDYDRFWLVLPLFRDDGTPLFSVDDKDAMLIVLINGKEGRVRWPIAPSIRKRIEDLSKNSVAQQDPSQE